MQGPVFMIYVTMTKQFLTLWGRAGLGPSRCKSPCRRPPQWSSPPPGPPAQSCWTGSCRAEGSDQAAPLSPSWCTTSQSLETHTYSLEIQISSRKQNKLSILQTLYEGWSIISCSHRSHLHERNIKYKLNRWNMTDFSDLEMAKNTRAKIGWIIQ